MASFWRKKSETTAAFRSRLDGDRLIIELLANDTPVPREQWTRQQSEAAGPLADLVSAAEAGGFEVVSAHDRLSIPSEAISSLSVATAGSLGLPLPTRLALDLSPKGGIQDAGFHVVARWVRPGGAPERCEVHGGVLKTTAGLSSIPTPLLSLYQAARALGSPIADEAERYRALANLKANWPEDPDVPVEADDYLRDLRLHYASAVSVKLTALTPDRTDFEPVLFGAPALTEAEIDDRSLNEELDSLLPDAAQRIFAKQRFYAGDGRKSSYLLRKGEYVYVDPAVRPILGEIRRLQGAPESERRDFVLNPAGTLRARLGTETADQLNIENLFVETEQFSERVAGVDVWRTPVMSWITPSGKNQWIPERFGLRIGDDYFAVTPSHASELIRRFSAADAASQKTVAVGDLLVPAAEGGPAAPPSLPITESVRAAVESLAPFAGAADRFDRPGVSDVEEHEWDAAVQGKLFLVVRNNFDEVEYASLGDDQQTPPFDLPALLPNGLRTRLKAHQTEGFEWLAKSARANRPGALLADDMGLGKTLQAITFMAWLKAEAAAGRREAGPMLIVAPTGLLANWQAEITKHLDDPWLGPLARAFGGDLKRLREESGIAERDIETGRAALDSGAWRQAGVVLTTYETLRDYHFSFARTRFSLIVYDEIQKLKNPASQLSRAARALNADFVLGMTGTPVENRLQDLWSIMDVMAPGLLGSSRDFEKRYAPENREALAELKSRLMESTPSGPPFMLRRMKSDALEGLPRKIVKTYPVDMPAPQAEAYRDVVINAAAASSAGALGKGGMLTYLAAMRGVSLHPQDPRSAVSNLGDYAGQSARVACALEILDTAQARNEKALVFVEDLAMQERFGQLVQARYQLPRRPMLINGGVAGHSRQKLVDAFQATPNQFDVLILSPKAGGVGLTITAANHVIHLSRWWNPAVEDQATDRVFRIGQTKDVYVHIPLAVHPDPALRDASFDLRLNDLIDRKRQLTRDLFLPADASDAELAGLFEDVSLTRAAPAEPDIGLSHPAIVVGTIASIPGEADAPVDEQPPAKRPTLTLPRSLEPTGVRIWSAEPRQPRPTVEILELFRSKRIQRMTISDPYALVSASSREAQIRFIDDMAGVADLKSVTIEYAPDVDDGDDYSWRRAIGTLFASSAAQRKGVTLNQQRREKKHRNDDFHDREVAFDVEHAGGAVRRHRLHLGRGLEALYDDRRQCTVTYAPPS